MVVEFQKVPLLPKFDFYPLIIKSNTNLGSAVKRLLKMKSKLLLN